MCGIAGVVTLDGADPEVGMAATMRDALLHRGPNGTGELDAAGVGLAACRLAIVDLEPRGLMPMASPDGRFHIVHNGEIYNRPELRDELNSAGVELTTTTDTEVILRLYERDGERMLDRLDGMFAFAIWDARRRELFAARDRVGEKPFYYAIHEGRLWFASEPKALFAAGVPCEFDPATWTELLTFRSVAGSRTAYRDVNRLLPGHWLRVRDGRLETAEWWRFPSEGAAVDGPTLGKSLEQSVRRRLIADVPVGTFLSGGLDSSAVTMLAARNVNGPLPAFTVRFPGTPLDEGRYAEPVARATGVEHHQLSVSEDEMIGLLVEAAWYNDEPVAFAAAPEQLAISRYATRHVRVMLSGESSDELFGGYTRMRLFRYPWAVRLAGPLLWPLRGRLRPGSRWGRIAVASGRSAADWVALSYADVNTDAFVDAPLTEWAPYRARAAAEAIAEHGEPVRAALAYERLVHLPAVLAIGDRMTMAAGLEARLPFTDPQLLALAGAAPPALLFDGVHGKRPLRDAMAGQLPQAVLARRKWGWTSPYRLYLRRAAPLRRWLAKVPDHPIVAQSPLGRAGARRMVDDFLGGDDSRGQLTWMLGRVVLWHQRCVEGERDPFGGSH